MLATTGSVGQLSGDSWAFEGKFDGCRLIVDNTGDDLRLFSRSGRDVTAEFPQLAWLRTQLAGVRVVLDGEAVALDNIGVPRFELMQNKSRSDDIQFWAFDILRHNDTDLTAQPYRVRRQMLELLRQVGIKVPALLDPHDPMGQVTKLDWEGVVAKRWDSRYESRRSRAWVKDKRWRECEVVIGGWREGEGRRAGTIGALLMGRPTDDTSRLAFVGRVGTGFSDATLARLKATLGAIETEKSPFVDLPRGETRSVTFVKPLLVGEVRYADQTSVGILRQPSWRGLRDDKTPADVN